MNVLIVSECSKNALKRTRQVVDQFAERKGARTWQTHITLEGLRTMRALLRRTARKNTAVACHWVRNKNHSELLWIVGNASCFNENGGVPTDTSGRDILRAHDEDDWCSLEVIRLLAALAALFHDFGKSSASFQKKLSAGKWAGDAFRHEWVSLRIFEAFVGRDGDEEWLKRLTRIRPDLQDSLMENLGRDGLDQKLRSPFRELPPLAQAVGWLMLSHHRLPTNRQAKVAPNPKGLARLPRGISVDWYAMQQGYTKEGGKSQSIENIDPAKCWQFRHALPFESVTWCTRAQKLARRLLNRMNDIEPECVGNSYVMHLARLSLTLADHYYSSLSAREKRESGDANPKLYANTRLEPDGKAVLNQPLDEHLIGVEKCAARIAHSLPRLEHELPRLARHKGFKRRTSDSRFRWQDRAFDLACALREKSRIQGFFGVNMASTGCGKTLGNGRIMYALANPVLGARFSIALGLRSLTLQTGEVYRRLMCLGRDDLAVMVGGGPWRDLFNFCMAKRGGGDRREEVLRGSESAQDLMDESSYVHYEGEISDSRIRRWIKDRRGALSLLNAPVLVCTIDHLMPASESLAGGHQIAPMMRLMTSDLVLDEPDDFGVEDLYALSRLVHLAGSLGTRVLLSSATLPPAMIEGLFSAYCSGRAIYRENRQIPKRSSQVCCAWFDEDCCEEGKHAAADEFMRQHNRWVSERVDRLGRCKIRRYGSLVPVQRENDEDLYGKLASTTLGCTHKLHEQHHVVDPETSKRVSFGLVRMANIGPLIQLTCALAAHGVEADTCLHICCYHSQHPLFIRSAMEGRLDRVLDRKDPEAAFEEATVRRAINRASAKNHLFLVLATPVAEVGRDHDYDWAIVEPSSMRSMIQVAGRVRRHRADGVDVPNMYFLEENVRALKTGNGQPVFCRPGFETQEFRLNSHVLSDVLREDQYRNITAIPRIIEEESEDPKENLAALEHDHLRAVMVGDHEGRKRVASADTWWTTHAWLSGELQRSHPFRQDKSGRVRIAVRYSTDDENIRFVRIEPDGAETEINDSLIDGVEIEYGKNVQNWGRMDYKEQLENLAVAMGTEPSACAERFGAVELPAYGEEQGWYQNDAFGFWNEM
jgi:CRISPR-associated endonuclease/helicase Cas3